MHMIRTEIGTRIYSFFFNQAYKSYAKTFFVNKAAVAEYLL